MTQTADAVTPRQGPNPWWVGFVSGMASFVDGAALTANGFALVIYQHTIGLTGNQVGILTSALTLGVAIGSLFGGRLGDRFGRRRVFIVTMALVVLGALLPIFGTSFGVLLAGLSILGLAVGADIPVSLATIAEAADDTNRGKILVLSGILWGLGIAAAITISTLTGGAGHIGGQLLYALLAVVGALVLLLRLTIPESASWLAARDERRRGIGSVRATRTRLSDLLRAPLRTRFLVLVVFFTLVTLPVTAFSSFGAYLAVNLAGVPIERYSAYTFFVFPIAMLTQLFFMRVVDTRYRLTFYLLGGACLTASFLIPVFFGFTLVTLIATMAMASFGGVFCAEPILRVWANEAFPTMLRSTAQGFIFGFARILSAMALAVTPALIAASPIGLFIGLTISAGLAVAVGWWGHRGGRAVNEFDHEQELAPEQAVLA